MGIFPYFFITINEKSWGSSYFPKDPKVKPYNDKTAFQFIFISVLSLGAISFFKALVVKLSIVKIGRQIHSRMVFRVLHSNVIKFIQRTPLGVILNRFSNDINKVDNAFSNVYIHFTNHIFGLIGAAVILFFGIQSFVVLIPLFFYIFVALWISSIYMKAKREVERLVKTSKSPLIGLPNSSISGGPQIRSLRLQQFFVRRMEESIENNSKNLVLSKALPFWFEFRVNLAKAFSLEIPLYLLMGFNLYNYKSENTAALVNFLFMVMSFAPRFTRLLRERQLIEIESISFERCFAYEDLEMETGYKKVGETSRIFENLNQGTEKRAWNYIQEHKRAELFEQGTVTFENVSAWYPTSEKRNINELNFEVPAGQKVGIVGRSGAGKSTFTKLLWRAVEPQEGAILVDGIKINDLDLKEFREQLNIILQKPNIFEGTLASNISSKRLTASEVSRISMEMRELGFPASKLSDGRLSYKVNISGNNLSLSEKQVICLMQSLQRQSKIVIMDEATAYVDPTMDEKFKKMIWSTFQNSTMFVIAHRINSVMDCDRIFVFEQGEIVEDGSPEELLADTSTIFYDMWSKGQ